MRTLPQWWTWQQFQWWWLRESIKNREYVWTHYQGLPGLLDSRWDRPWWIRIYWAWKMLGYKHGG